MDAVAVYKHLYELMGDSPEVPAKIYYDFACLELSKSFQILT
jgi:hypothetical protein